MAQTGYTPILIYSSSTTTNAPAVGNLTNSTLGSELAINITDGKLFYKDNANAIQVIAWKTTPTTAGGTGLTSYTAGDLVYYSSGTTLTKLAIGSAYQALQVNAGGTAPSWQASATSTLTAQGDLLYASAANTLARLAKNTSATRYLSNTGTSNNPAWAQIDLTNGVTGTLPTTNGGTNLTSFTANGIVYASSTSALTTGSAITFDGTNFSTTGSATATRFIPSGSTVPTNGMYLPATNVVGFSNNSVETARFTDTGRLFINTTASLSGLSGMLQIQQKSAATGIILQVNANSDTGIRFLNASGTQVGSIVIDSASVSYNQTSDYRLKDNVQPLSDGLTRILQLKPCTYVWKSNGLMSEGFLAYEVAEVCPQAVTGLKDGKEMQSIDYSKLIPILSAALRDAIKEIELLKNRIVRLES